MKHIRIKVGMAAAFALAAATAMAQGGISVTVNGDPVQFAGTGPQMVNGRVLVPLRGVFEKLGASVQWIPARREVVATRGQSSVDLQIGNTTATVNGQGVTLDVPAEIVNGSTMVPIRFVSEAIGAQVRWIEAEQQVVITADTAQAAEPAPAPVEAPAPDAGQGPIRMARISMIQGGVNWRPGDDVDWSGGAPNLPLRQGAELWLNPGARAEVQFDDGSYLRLTNGAIAVLHTMYSDSRGEFTEIRLNTGTASLRLTSSLSSYQVDTPIASITSAGTSSFRVDATNGLRVADRSGQARVQSDAGQVTLFGGQYLRLANGGSGYAVMTGLSPDDWDRFCDQRDGIILRPSPYLPSSIALVAGDLNGNGAWVRDPQYGYCWHPTAVDPGWAPYRSGHWVWVSPFGWTWCGNEQWGWAPYHYGTWFSGQNGWCWRPGPAQQCWSPAVVHFSTAGGIIAWCALAPAEVRYPAAVSIQFGGGNWAASFSIGGAACYYPQQGGYCTPRPWNNVEINRTTNVYNVTRITNITNVYVSNNGFVPRNSRVAGGATIASNAEFGGRGSFAPATAANATIFTKGQTFAPPGAGGARFAGPTSVRPTRASFSPAAALSTARPDPRIMNRAVVRAPLPGRIGTWGGSMASAKVIVPKRIAPTRPTNPRITNPRTPTPKVTSPAPRPVRPAPRTSTPATVRPGAPKPPVIKPAAPNPKDRIPKKPVGVAPAPKPAPARPVKPIAPARTAPARPTRVAPPARPAPIPRTPAPVKRTPPPHKPVPKDKKGKKEKTDGG